jgi:hypothetical protein
VSDGKKVVRVRIGYMSVQLRWIVRSQELGFVRTCVIAVGFLDPPFWLQIYVGGGTFTIYVPLFLQNVK